MPAAYRAAIIGTGRIGSTYDDQIPTQRPGDFYSGARRHSGLYTVHPINHAGAYRSTPGFSLIAASNRGDEKLRAFGERWDVQALYTDFRRLFYEEKPDVVSVCTQSPEKAEIVIAAAEAGVKAIVVEKAMATSMAEADAMIAVCDANGVFLVVNHPYRFSPMARQAKAAITAGEIGEVGVLSGFSVAGMLHVGTHTFDLMRFLGGDAIEIDARIPNYAPDQDLPASGTIKFASGAIGFFDHVHGVREGVEARGTAGSIHVSSSVGDGTITRLGLMDPDSPRKDPSQIVTEPLWSGPHQLSMTQRLFAELHDTLETGAPFMSTGRDGAAALELCLGCFASHRAGGPVSLPLADRDLRVPNR